jgi:glycosyltransferase involved in cell wall biosynthesis
MLLPQLRRHLSKILYIGNKLSAYGYTATMVEILEPLLQNRYEVTSASSARNVWWRILNMIGAFLRLRAKLSVVLIDTFSARSFYYCLVMAALSRLFRKPYITILHGGNLPMRLRQNPMLSRFIFGHSAVNIAPSGYLHHAFLQAGYSAVLIPNFLDISKYKYAHRVYVRARFLWVRSFHQQYNPEMAIRVVASLAPSYPAIQLCMVGPDKDGSMEQCKQLAVELGVADRIVFTGLLSKAEWIALSANYDMFINTTNFDNTPVSVIEAMALGLPVVSTNAGGMPYLIDHGQDGWLTPQGDEKIFAAAVSHLLEHPDLAFQLSQKARQKVEQYDWEVVKHQWFEVIDRAISHSRKEGTI